MTAVAVKKLSISLSEDVADAAVRVAERAGVSLSTWLNEAAERAIKLADGRDAIEDYWAEHGPPSAETLAWLDETLAAVADD